MKKIEYFLIYCSTGCSCCNGENHYRGPFSSKEIADARVPQYREQRILASQYSSRGNYSVVGPYQGEQLHDGRIIAGDSVYQGFMDNQPPGSDDERAPH